MKIEHLLPLLERVKAVGEGKYQASCPSHPDGKPSLSLRQANDKVLVFCHAGCSLEEISDAIGISPKDWFDDSQVTAATRVARNERANIAEANRNMTAAAAGDVRRIGLELRRRDMERIAITERVKHGELSEDQAMTLLAPIYIGYNELEYEFEQALRNTR